MASPQADATYIHCEDLFKIYKSEDLEVVALRGLDLRVAQGEMMAIVGASGSGKSTLLNILAGLDTPSAGRVSVGGRDLLTISDDDLVAYRRTEVGFVWQQTGRNLIPYLTAAQNIEVPMILNGESPRAARERAASLLAQVGLAGRSRNRPEELSGGEQQRVAIGVALANNPPLLLGDEPTGELDDATATEVFDVLRELNETTGVTLVIVTHDHTVIDRVDRVVSIRDGRASSEFVRQPTFDRSERGVVDEFAVVDRSGRLQIPREFVDQLQLGSRARLQLVDDHIELRPEGAGAAPDHTADVADHPGDGTDPTADVTGHTPNAAPPEAATPTPDDPAAGEGPSPWQRP